MTLELTPRQFSAAAIIAIVLAGAFVYWNTSTGEFVWDDVSSVLIHEDVKDPSRIGQLFTKDQHAYGRGQGAFYRPLLSLTFMADYAIASWGLPARQLGRVPDVAPFVFHLSSALWHIAAAIALFGVLVRFRAPRFVQAATPLLYVVHPLHTEAVAYISGRADSMAAFFIFAGIWCALTPGGTDRRITGAILAALCAGGAAFSKESGAMLPVLLLAAGLVLTFTMKNDERYQGATALNFLPAALSGIVLLLYVRVRMVLDLQSESQAPDSTFGERIIETLQAVALYTKLAVLPSGLHMERTLEGVPGLLAVAGAAVLFAAIAVLVYAIRRRDANLTMAVVLALVTWFPISGLIPLNAPMAEHWLYVPLAGALWAVLLLAWRAAGAWELRGAVAALAIAFSLYFTVVTVERNEDWQDNVSLFTATLAENPKSLRVHYNLAVTYESLEENYPAAKRHYERVIALYEDQRTPADPLPPQELEAHISLAQMAAHDGRYQKAYERYTFALEKAALQQNAQYAGVAALGAAESLIASGRIDLAQRHLAHYSRQLPGLEAEAGRLLAGRTSEALF